MYFTTIQMGLFFILYSSFFISAKPSRFTFYRFTLYSSRFTSKNFHQHLIDLVNRFEFHSL